MQKMQGISLGKHDYSSWLLPTRVLFFAFLVSIFSIINKNSVYADTYSASLSGTDLVDINLTGASGSSTTNSTITANTTCPNGYTISINGTNDNNTSDFNLYLDGNDSEITNIFTTSHGTLSTPAVLSADTWGILVYDNLYSGVSRTPVPWFNVGMGDYTPGVNNTHTLTYGALHGGSLSAGTYSMADNGRIVYTLEMDNTCTSYTVAFNANEPTDAPAATGTMENQTITEGVATPLAANTYKVDGYAFVGWNTAADGSGTTYADKASVTNLTTANTTITLYAQWALNVIQNYARCPYLEVGDTELLTDIRDGKTYWIAKMADGHCWMTQNLDLDLETTPNKVTALTSENTDLTTYNIDGYTSALGYSQDPTTEVITWTPERDTVSTANYNADTWATSNDYTHPYSLDLSSYYYTDTYEPTLGGTGYDFLITDNPTYIKTTQYAGNGVHGRLGNYYTWSAAVASNDTSTYHSSTYADISNNPQNSICPAGWRLPLTTSASPNYTVQGSRDEAKRLNYVVNNFNNVTDSSRQLEANPLYLTRAGYAETGTITRAGRGSGIWTSTVSNTTDSKTLYFAGNKIVAPSDSDRNLGYPIRCVSRDEAVVYRTISFQANEPAGAGTATGTMASQTIANGASANLEINAFELGGYIFNGWNTSADGTGTSYANGASITPTADIILYAQWTRSYSLTYNFGNKSFNGTNILNTDIALFDTDLVNKDFTLSFGIANAAKVSGQSDDWNNVASAMSEAGQPYPGFVIRYKGNNATNNQYRFIANASDSEKSDTGTLYDNSNGVLLERKSGLIYLNSITTPILDFNQLTSPFSTPLTFGAGLNGSNQPFRYSSNDLSNITLRVEYTHNDTVTLPNPTMTNDTFLKWNTAADCSGVDYSAGSSLTITGATTLYPCWQSNTTHTITFLANAPTGTTATGTMTNQTVSEGVATALTTNAYAVNGYTFRGWNTAADGSGTDYADKEPVTLTSDLTLYAKWLDNSLITKHALTFNFGNESFDSTNYINTDIGLFGSVLNNKDFELSFSIANSVYTTQSGNFNNIANSMDESGSPYPGFVVRYNSSQAGNQYNYNANATTASADKANKNVNITNGFKLQRIDGIAYLNDDTNTASPNFNHLASTFETPLTFGAGLNGSGQPFRYATVDISDIILKLTLESTDTYTLPNPTKTNYTFVEWNTAADGTGIGYDAGDIVTMSSDLTLYPIWDPIVPVVNEYHAINLEKTRGTSTATIDLTGMDMGTSIKYSSSDTSVATVDSNGTVTAVNPGETTITVLGAKRAYYNVYVSEPGVPLFNITPDPIQVYYNSRDIWDTTKTKANFLANMRETFENYGCKIYNYRDNNGYLDSAVAYGWTDGSNYCDQSKAYDTGQTGALNVYLYDTVNQRKTGNALSYTGATNGLIYNMIPGETYYWELADDSTTYGLVKATGKHRILNFTQGDYSRVSGSQITRNTREIGGLPVDTDYNGTIDGYTNYGRIFRAERLWTSNNYNVNKFTNLGANFEIDVRSSKEGSTDSRLAGYRNDTVVQYAVKQGVDASNYNTLRAVVTRAMQNVINGDNIYFHCSYGSDRTGTLAWVLEGLLGVTDEARLGDYELSTFYGAVDRNRYFEYEGSNTKRFTYMMTFLKTGQDVYDWYMYGSSNKTTDAALINNFRAAMITKSGSAAPQGVGN